MFALNLVIRYLFAFLLTTSLSFAESTPIVAHEDPIEIDESLTLSQVIDLTLEKFPELAWLKSLEDEAAAIALRSKSWTAGASQANYSFQEAATGANGGKLHYITAGVQVPLWNVGQRDAEQAVGEQAESSAKTQTIATKLRVAGLVRNALWDIDLQKIRYEQAQAEIKVYEELHEKIGRRVELGDSPRSDVLLAETELLQRRSTLIQAEAELMHARKRYASITQITKVPKDYHEKLVDLKESEQNHPALVAINSQQTRKQAELDALRAVGSGQTNVLAGVTGDMGDTASNHTASFHIGVIVPFGGSDHLAPQLAAINVELNKIMSEREQLFRDLQHAHHEAEHNLEVNHAELVNANALKTATEKLLNMSKTAYSVGEIDLIDLIKIGDKAQQAILNVKEKEVMLERDIALYNQAVGVMP
ncbi:MAG: TolC family protein [Methylococcales bacterium]|nr:TolC family protein [Methylococcales bacterium]